jgi:hemolysin type calcium-binding protein
MRSFGLALVALAMLAAPASAAELSFTDLACGCDPSSGDEDTRTLNFRAAPGEANRLSIRTTPGGVLVEELGAPLTGACRPMADGRRFCAGSIDDVAIELGDAGDTVIVEGIGAGVRDGPGDDSVLVRYGFNVFQAGPGADRLEAGGAARASVRYADHTEGVTVRLNGLPDDGAAGEGDDVRGTITGIQGGAGNDLLEAGPDVTGIVGMGGNDRLLGGPLGEVILGGPGDDIVDAGGGNDHISGDEGADVLGGGPGRDEAGWLDSRRPLRLSIGDGPNDGAAGEGTTCSPTSRTSPEAGGATCSWATRDRTGSTARAAGIRCSAATGPTCSWAPAATCSTRVRVWTA